MSDSLHLLFFFFNDTATTEIYPLSLHDALPISGPPPGAGPVRQPGRSRRGGAASRSEEHTSELQSQSNLVCRLLLEKKKIKPLRRRLDSVDAPGVFHMQHFTVWRSLTSTPLAYG